MTNGQEVCGDTGKGMIHIQDRRVAVRFHHVTQIGVQLKNCELFISGIFSLIPLGLC